MLVEGFRNSLRHQHTTKVWRLLFNFLDESTPVFIQIREENTNHIICYITSSFQIYYGKTSSAAPSQKPVTLDRVRPTEEATHFALMQVHPDGSIQLSLRNKEFLLDSLSALFSHQRLTPCPEITNPTDGHLMCLTVHPGYVQFV